MPSPEHQAFVDLFRSDPSLVVALSPKGVGVGGPYAVGESTFSTVSSIDFHADLFVQPPDSAPPEVSNVAVEIQLGIDPEKLRSWPVYQTMGWRATGRLTCVLVVTPYDAVATWARGVIQTGPGQSTSEVFAVGPHEIPRIVDPADARGHPALAALSALAHAGEPDALEVAKCGMTALGAGTFGAETRQIIYDQIWSRLDPALYRALEAFMNQEPYVFKSAHVLGLLAKGRAEGLEEGREEGRAQAAVEGRIDAILVALRERHIRLSAGQKATITACRDLDQLNTWFKRALSVTKARQLFDE